MAELEKRIEVLEAKRMISELRAAYARFASRGDAYGVAGLFTEDCVFDGPSAKTDSGRAVVQGRKNLGDFLAPQIGRVGAVLPLIHNEITEVDGDRATGWCVMDTPMSPDHGHIVCEYFEELKRIGGKWYFARRTMYLFKPFYEKRPPEYASMGPALL